MKEIRALEPPAIERRVSAEKRKRVSKLAAICILSAIFGEAGNQPDVGKQAIASVIFNRAKQTHRDVCTVVHQRGQFRPRRPPKSFRFAYNRTDPTDGSLFFRNYGGPWKGAKFVKKIGAHYFYRKAE